MSRRVITGLAALALAASRLGAQDSAQRSPCRDPHPAPACGSYVVFELAAAHLVSGTRVHVPFSEGPGLESWIGWDVGVMRNRSPTTSGGGAVEIGGSRHRARVAFRGKIRRWLDHGFVVDASAGPLIAHVPTGRGVREAYGATGDVGAGLARLGLVTVGGDVAFQDKTMQLAWYVGAKAESSGAVAFTVLAALAGLIAESR